MSAGERGLTFRQQRFVDEYLIDLNATQAAIRAGYSAKNADKIGPELLGKTRVAAAIRAAQQRRAQKLELTQEKVLFDLEQARLGAVGAEQFTAAIRASELQGKHLGMFVERHEHGVTESLVDLLRGTEARAREEKK